MIIAVDFDGTIVEHRYPHIGKEIPFATQALKQLQSEGHALILWTAREGKLLQEAIDFCEKRGVEFFAVNSNYPGEEVDAAGIRARKLHADLFIDDRAVGGLPEWVRSVRSSATVGPGDSTTNTSVLSLNLKRKAFLPDCLENRPSRRLDEFCDSIKCHHLEIKQLKE